MMVKVDPGRVVALQTILVPAGHEAIVKSSVVNKLSSPCKQSFLGILTPEKLFMEKFGLAIARTLVDSNQSVIFTRVFNPGSSDVTIYQNTHMALFTPIDKECFAKPGEVGRTNLGSHSIKLNDEKPVREPPRRIPLYKRQAVEDEINKLEAQGLIEKSISPWSSQIVMVQKERPVLENVCGL
ncbi:Hypothetical predicted protein [Mytilus galloprovincialis]|uniref:Uncharacterized protein n=1 Tax=Mytilus galloprovincialis TaxID=29158 RepID=A0A8B6CFH3_MYTGA|nr:Hypothetical predicted protein [Mytilus galloprovincialis]